MDMLMMMNSSSKRNPRGGYFFVQPEIVQDILSRLPVKALRRFQCVCKPWQALISTFDLNRQRLLFAPSLVNPQPFLSINYEDFSKNVEGAIKEVPCPEIIDEPNTNVTFLGSCRGLVCLQIENKDDIFVIWNPNTRETKVFPRLTPAVKNDYTAFHGFGYDPSTEDYKVIFACRGPLKSTVIEVFSVKMNKWTTLIDLVYENLTIRDEQGSYANGALHWIKVGFMKISILSFNLSENKLEEILPLPNLGPRSSFELTSLGLGTTKNHLFVHSGSENPSLSIWVMKEFGVRDSWTRVLRIPAKVIRREFEPCDHNLKPVCILDSGEVLMAHDSTCLLLYDPKAKTFESIFPEEEEDEDDISMFEVISYEETQESLPEAPEVVELEEELDW